MNILLVISKFLNEDIFQNNDLFENNIQEKEFLFLLII